MRLVYLSPVPLDSFAQRPHHFVHWFHHRHSARVLWIDPYPTRLPNAEDVSRIARRATASLGPSWIGEPWLAHLAPKALPLEPFAWGRWMNRLLWRPLIAAIDAFVDEATWIVAGKPSALAERLFGLYPDHPKAYDAMDHFPGFLTGRSARWMEIAEHQLARRADWVVAASSPLGLKFSELGPRLRIARNALSDLHQDPACDEGVDAPSPWVFGYVGSIARWFDWGAVEQVAALHPEARIRLYGPLETSAPRLPANVELRGAIPHEKVYTTLSEFTAGLIPFKVDPLTEFVDPVKYYEYRAMGLPVLSTRFGEMRLRGPGDHVLFFDNISPQTDFGALRRAAGSDETVQEFRRRNLWQVRFDALDFLQMQRLDQPAQFASTRK